MQRQPLPNVPPQYIPGTPNVLGGVGPTQSPINTGGGVAGGGFGNYGIAGTGGMPARNPRGDIPAPPSGPAYGDPRLFAGAVTQQAGDYDKIMKNYEQLFANSTDPTKKPLEFTPITPQLYNYSPSADVTSSLSNLGGLAATGGYSQGDIANIRARSISPIRSIYANAQANLERNRALSGGYSPNYTAASTRMARDLSEQIGQRTTDVEAGIAERVAQNKLGIAPTWASAAQSENAARTSADASNADTQNRVAMFNAQMPLEYQQANQVRNNNALASVEGMRGLYGTTPALVNEFGNQVGQAAQLGQNQQNINNAMTNERLRRRQSMFGA